MALKTCLSQICKDGVEIQRGVRKISRRGPRSVDDAEGCPILSSRFHRKKGSYESLDSSNGESLLTIRQVELSIGKLHLIRGT